MKPDFKEASIANLRAALETQQVTAQRLKEIENSILAHEEAQVELGQSVKRVEANVEILLGEFRTMNKRLGHYLEDHDQLGQRVNETRRETDKLRAQLEELRRG